MSDMQAMFDNVVHQTSLKCLIITRRCRTCTPGHMTASTAPVTRMRDIEHDNITDDQSRPPDQMSTWPIQMQGSSLRRGESYMQFSVESPHTEPTMAKHVQDEDRDEYTRT